MKTPKVRGLRSIKKDIIKLIDTYIESTLDLNGVYCNMVCPFLDVALSDYNSSVNIARDPELLNAIGTMVTKLGVSKAICIYHQV